MIKRSVIKSTAHCWWSDDDDCYLIESPLFSVAIGTGETPLAAWLDYDSVLDQFYEELTHGSVGGYDSKGRPAKGGVNLHCQVQQKTKKTLNELAAEIECSQGELVDWMTFVLTHQRSAPTQSPKESDYKFSGNWQAQVRESAIDGKNSAERKIELIEAILFNEEPDSGGYAVRGAKQVSVSKKSTKPQVKTTKRSR